MYNTSCRREMDTKHLGKLVLPAPPSVTFLVSDQLPSFLGPEFRPLTWEIGPLLHMATATIITSSCSLLPSPSSFLEPSLLYTSFLTQQAIAHSNNVLIPQAQDRAQGRSKQCYALVDWCPFSLSFQCPHLWAKGPIPIIYQSLA